LTSSLFGKSTALQGGFGSSSNAVRRFTLQVNFTF